MTTQIKLASIESTALNTLQGPRITSVQVDVDSGYTSSTANAVSLSGGYISINGSGFVTGCSVIIGSLTATSVSFVSSIKVNCLIPAQSAGTYTIYLINPDGSTAIRVNSVQYSSYGLRTGNAAYEVGEQTRL
jgi:subtilisin-like proprotein convertase family protein